MSPSYAELSTNWHLWCEYVNPSGAQSRAEWDALSVEERIALCVACFGEEENDDLA